MSPAALAADWERRLRAEGLGVDELEAPAAVTLSSKSLRVGTAKPETAEYYIAARALLDTHHFRSIRDRRAWELHAEGAGAGAIAKALRCSRWQAQRAVARGKKAMGVAVPEVYFARDRLTPIGKMGKHGAVDAVRHMRVSELMGVARALAVGMLRRTVAT